MDDYDEFREAEQNAPVWFFILVWLGWVIVTIAGYLAGKWLAESVAGMITGDTARRVLSIEGHIVDAGASSYVAALLGGAFAGLALGLAQALVLLPFLKMAGAVEWLAATAIGRAVQWVVISVIGLQMAGLTVDKSTVGDCLLLALLGVTGVLGGAALGYPQGQVFKARSRGTRVWLVASMIGPVTTSLVLALTLMIEAQNTIRDGTSLLTAFLAAIATAFALLEVLRHPRAGAEWQGVLTWKPAVSARPPVENTVLGSSLYTARPEPPPMKEVSGAEPGADT